MKPIQVTDEAHAAVKEAAEAAGVPMSAWASERLEAPMLLADRTVTLPSIEGLDRLAAIALSRTQSPAETLAAALDALERPTGLLVPAPPRKAQECHCDGPEEDGPHHRPGCHRRVP